MNGTGTNGKDDRRGRFTETKGGNKMIRKLVTTTGMLVAGAALFLGSGLLGASPAFAERDDEPWDGTTTASDVAEYCELSGGHPVYVYDVDGKVYAVECIYSDGSGWQCIDVGGTGLYFSFCTPWSDRYVAPTTDFSIAGSGASKVDRSGGATLGGTEAVTRTSGQGNTLAGSGFSISESGLGASTPFAQPDNSYEPQSPGELISRCTSVALPPTLVITIDGVYVECVYPDGSGWMCGEIGPVLDYDCISWDDKGQFGLSVTSGYSITGNGASRVDFATGGALGGTTVVAREGELAPPEDDSKPKPPLGSVGIARPGAVVVATVETPQAGDDKADDEPVVEPTDGAADAEPAVEQPAPSPAEANANNVESAEPNAPVVEAPQTDAVTSETALLAGRSGTSLDLGFLALAGLALVGPSTATVLLLRRRTDDTK